MTVRWVLLFGGAFVASAVTAAPATFSSGLEAEVHREIATGPNSKSFTYTVLGATNLTVQGQAARALSVECIGIDSEAKSGTSGQGSCIWKENNTDVLYLALKTSASGNRYTVTGGTGKWAGATGEFDTSFTYLPGPQNVLLLTENGRGEIAAAK